MLKELTIDNFALIEHLELEFSSGLNVLTGETGAGKSIIIDAVGLLLGQRAKQEYIRQGAKKAVVSGLFAVHDKPAVRSLLAEMGLPEDEEGNLVLSRQITASGNNTCRVNGQPVTLAMYQKFGSLLVDIHGQHDHQSLLSKDMQRQLLDEYCGSEADKLKAKLRDLYHDWQQTERQLQDLLRNAEEIAREEDYYKFQLEEIDKAGLTPGEEEELEREKQRLDGAETLATGADKIRVLLYDGGPGELSAYDAISQAINELQRMLHYDKELQPLVESLEQALYQVEECAGEVRRYADGLSFDPQRIDQVESRLHLLRQLKRKYGSTVADILAYRDQIAASLEELSHREENQEQLQQAIARLKKQYYEYAGQLTEVRRQGARKLIDRLSGLWKDLAMEATRFYVAIREVSPQPHGKDEVEFLISPNPGEDLKSLAKIASGGELSRVMLALKTVLAELDLIPTMIFDEIDTGIGGETIRKVAEKLATIAEHRQVLCVTHSAAIAAKAHRHFAISKEVVGGRTVTYCKPLEPEQRVRELARMLGGTNQVAIEHAKELLKA